VPKPSSIVVIPTYNEAQSLEKLLPELLALNVDILIVDDSSSDGTVEVAQKNNSENRISFISRPTKLGLGSAYLAGFAQSLSLGYEEIIQMDADGSHQVKDLINMREVMANNPRTDLIIGSRWIPGGKVENWAKRRELLSRTANRYSKWILATKVSDMTAGFRIYRASLLKKMNLQAIASQGYGFQIEMTREAIRVGAAITEVPITFIERTMGKSKMSNKIVREAIVNVTKWGFQRTYQRPDRG
jgi:dolichol-phosphate mannosyltransferase